MKINVKILTDNKAFEWQENQKFTYNLRPYRPKSEVIDGITTNYLTISTNEQR